MSAFGGYCFWDGRPDLRDRLSVLGAHLEVGGPDASGTVNPTPWVALQSHLLHFDRLSAGEKQPYRFGQGSVLTWDGRLDNRDDLLLSLHRHLGPDKSDAALVAAAYEHWGEAAMPRLIGDWCLAIWDAPQQRLILARDYAGNRPLYYLAEANRLVWATRLEALAASENLFGAPDDIYIARFLTLTPSSDLTPFTGASTLLAGHVLIGTREGTTVRRYWKYTPATLRYRRPDEYADHLRHLLAEAVRVRLRASRRVWAHLSGGWDSSSVVCLAHRLIEERCVEAPALQPLSCVYSDPEAAREREFIAAVEQWCGIQTVVQPFRHRHTFAEMLGYQTPVPIGEGVGLEDPVRTAGDRIVLTGLMGDLAMGQGGAQLAPMWEPFDAGHPWLFLRGLRAYALMRKRPFIGVLLRAALDRFGPRFKHATSYARRRAWVRSDSVNNGLTPELWARSCARLPVARPSAAEFPPLHRVIVDLLYRHADEGVFSNPEFMTPVICLTHSYTHRPLIEFLLAVPRLVLFDPLIVRAGMRRALNDILPPAILERTTKVGVHPTALGRSRHRHAELTKDVPPITDAMTQWCLVQRGVVESNVLAGDIRRMRAGERPSDLVYRCLHIEAWLRSLATRQPDVREERRALLA